MALSSSALGIRTVGRLEIFDIVFRLATIGTEQTDGPSHFTTVYKRHVVQNVCSEATWLKLSNKRLELSGRRREDVKLEPAKMYAAPLVRA
jgi:hypothetical protein